MYLIEFINEDRDIVLRQSFKNLKELYNATLSLRTSLTELEMQSNEIISYADVSADGVLICRFNSDDIYVSLSLRGLRKHHGFYDAIPSTFAWAKLWVEPSVEKFNAFLKVTQSAEKLLPYVSAFRCGGRVYSIDDTDSIPGRLVVLQDKPDTIYISTPSGYTRLGSVESFEPIEMYLSLSPLISILDYGEVNLCPRR